MRGCREDSTTKFAGARRSGPVTHPTSTVHRLTPSGGGADRLQHSGCFEPKQCFVVQSYDASMHRGDANGEKPLERLPDVFCSEEDRLEDLPPVVFSLDDQLVVAEVRELDGILFRLARLGRLLPLRTPYVRHSGREPEHPLLSERIRHGAHDEFA